MKRWHEQTLSPVLKKSPERKAEFISEANIPIKRLYTPADLAGRDYEQDLGFPGQAPFTRGVYPTMYRGRFWTIRPYSGFWHATGDQPALQIPPRASTKRP
jgi:methylmalonyl-CoA mutase, N-terminal domain